MNTYFNFVEGGGGGGGGGTKLSEYLQLALSTLQKLRVGENVPEALL